MKKNLPIDFHATLFCGEARQNLGEDNWAYGYCGSEALIAVFDGCGGSGARRHDEYGGHSEAFMAARLCSGAVYECIQSHFPLHMPPTAFVHEILEPYIRNVLRVNIPSPKASGIQIRGMRTLPTTMAAALIQSAEGDQLEISPIWAGDSRVYLLDSTGLSQLTVDDSNQPDPMEGLYDEGTLTNVICVDKPFSLHCRTIRVRKPCLVIAATDGCFGYVSSPMEFEGMILHTLLETDNVAQWEDHLQKLIAHYAGDDHTMCMLSLGYGNFCALQQDFRKR